MNLLSVLPEGLQIEEGLWAGLWWGQPNTQMGLVHMGANGHMRGGKSFMATLNLALLDPLACHIQMKGCHVGGSSNLQGLRDGQGGSLLCLYAPSAMGVEDSRSTSSDFCGGGLHMVTVGVSQCLLTGGWAINIAEWDQVPCKSSCNPSALDPATANSTFWRPTASRC